MIESVKREYCQGGTMNLREKRIGAHGLSSLEICKSFRHILQPTLEIVAISKEKKLRWTDAVKLELREANSIVV